MNDGTVQLNIEGGIASILIERPQARNSMTGAMYEQLAAICDQLGSDAGIRAAVLRGAGGEAFVAGSDIAQFTAFKGEDDGVAYERKIDALIGKLERLPFPTIAVLEGWVMGGGLAIATVCDFRIAAPTAVFGVPIARTLGNCLSVANTARLVAAFGMARAKRILLLADTIGAEEALSCGFLLEIAEAPELDGKARALCERLARNAPLTMAASKEAIRRVLIEGLPSGEDLVRSCYGSEDFKLGVAAFLDKKRPAWTGS